MRTLRILLPLLALTLLPLNVTFAQKNSLPAPAANAEFVADELIIKYKATALPPSRTQTLERLQAFPKGEIEGTSAVVVRLSGDLTPLEAARLLQNDPAVEYAEPNYIYHASYIPNDSRFTSQYGPQKIGAPAAWDIWQGSASTIIAIVDTGINKSHPDLASKIVAAQYDFANDDADAQDDHWHGTHCAGIAAASTNNAAGIAGIGFNASLMAVKVLNASGSGSLSSVASGIRFATDNGAQVISLSLGGPGSVSTLQQAVDYAWSKGVVVVAAAGNENTSALSYPGAYANAIAVGATDSADTRASFSNFGNWVDVAAPGVNILSAYQNTYAYASGTSMACPHVAGAAGLLYSYLGTRSPANAQAVRSLLEFNGVNVGTWNTFGRIDLAASMSVATHPAVVGIAFPTTVTPEVGTVTGGNLTSVSYRDNLFYTLASAPSASGNTAAYNVSGNVPAGTVTQLQVFFAGKVDITGVTLTLQAYNAVTTTWETVQTLPAPTTDTLTIPTLPGSLRRFVGANGAVRFRVQATHPSQPFTFSANLTRWHATTK